MAHTDSLNALYARRARLRKRWNELGHLLRGSVVVLSRPCTYPRCRKCQDGTRHPATYHSVSKASQTHLTYMPKAVETEARGWNENWKDALKIADALTEVNLQILRIKAQKARERKTSSD